MTHAETDRREVFLHAAAESGLQAGIDAVFRMGVDWGAENATTIHRSRGQLHRKKIAAVALELGTTPEQLWGVGRDREMSQKRHLAAWLLRRRYRLSYPAIGRTMHRDHSTCMHSVRTVEEAPGLLAWGQMLLERGAAERAA